MTDDDLDWPPGEQERAALFDRCRAALEHLPEGTAFSHLTAARLHGLPLSPAMETDQRIHVIRPITRSKVRQPDVVGHRALHPRSVVDVEGLPVVGLADTWADLGELIGRGKPVGLDDMIVIGDAIATALRDVQPLRQAIEKRVRPRGKRTLIEALALIRVGSASPRETVLRIMLVRVGMPEPLLNEPVFAADDPDRRLGVADVLWLLEREGGEAPLRVAGEYQGKAYHSSDEQRAHDLLRRQGFEDDGCRVEWVWAEDLADFGSRRATCRRFAAALEIPVESLDLDACLPRFFSQHRIDEAIRRDDARRSRSA